MAMGMAGGRRSRRHGSRRAPMAEINVTPFVDVMLVLLIIFMVTAPLLASGVPVQLPESRANPVDQEPDQVTVAVDREGFVYIDDLRIESGGLPLALESLAGPLGAEQPLINLRADRDIDWGRAMAVMGELNRAGFTKISLITTPGAGADVAPGAEPSVDASAQSAPTPDSPPAAGASEAAEVSATADGDAGPVSGGSAEGASLSE